MEKTEEKLSNSSIRIGYMLNQFTKSGLHKTKEPAIDAGLKQIY